MPLANSPTMNTAPVIHVSVQPTGGPSSTAGGADNTAKAGGAQSAFAGALNAAAANPSRRTGPSKQSDDSAPGGSLPPAGSQSPPVPVPQAAAAPVATPHSKGSPPADHPRQERARGRAPVDNPLAVQAAAGPAGVANIALGGVTIAGANAATGIATTAATNATTKNAATFGAVDAQRATEAKIESGLAAKSAAAAKAAATLHPAADSGTVRADGGAADSAFSQASASSGDPSLASGVANAPAAAVIGTGTQDAAVTGAAGLAATVAAAAAGSPQSANTGKARGDNSFDSDASLNALGAGADAAAAAASAPPGRLGMRAAADPLIASNAVSASMVADAGKHAHAGFDLAALTGNSSDAAAGLSQLSANASVAAPADATPAPALRIHASVDSSDFPQGLSDRVSWMVDNGVNGAKLQVNPPQLGPIELRISVQGDHAQVWMTTHSAVARDALESSSPKLREMLNAQGFGQVSVDISQRSFQDRSADTPQYQRESAGVRSAAVTPAAPATAVSTPRSLQGALDAYA
jgi:flagellar hook-length control protein FliK